MHLPFAVEEPRPHAGRADVDPQEEARVRHRARAPEHPHAKPELLGERDHLAEHVAISDGHVVRQVVRHQRVARDPHVGRHERPLARRPLPPRVADGGRQLHDLTAADVHPQDAVLDVRARPRHRARQALAGERAARRREVERRLPVRVNALQGVRFVVERVRAARARVQEHPQKAPFVLSTPAHVVEHDGLMEPFLFAEALQELHGNDVPLVGLRRRRDRVAVRLRAARRVEEALGEIRRRAQRDEAELVLPAQAVRRELVHEIERDEVVAELLARRVLVEVVGAVLLPVEGDALALHEGEGAVDALVLDALTAIDDPRLVDLVLGEAVWMEEAGAEITVDHPHRRVAEHEDQDLAGVDLTCDLASKCRCPLAHRRVVRDLALFVGDRSAAAPLLQARHEGVVLRPVRRVGPRAREGATEHLEARARVEQAHEARPAAGEVAREQERVVLADDAVARVRGVEPVDADADHRVVDRAELLDRFVRLREKTLDPVRGATEFLQRPLHLGGGFEDARLRELVRLRARVAGPEQRDLFSHAGRVNGEG